MGIISSLIGGAFSLIGQGKANKRNMSINAANNDFNAKQAQLARDWQEEQYNKYSSPSALVRQYEEAGLNPALVAGVGQGATFSGSSASSASPIAMQNPYGGIGLEVANLIETVKNNKSLRNLQQEQSETEQAKQDNLAADTEQKNIDNETRSELNKINIASISQNISESLNRISNDNKRVENEVKHIDGILSQIASSNSVNAKQIEQIDANIKYINKQGVLSDEQKAYYAAQTVLLGYKQSTEQKLTDLTDSQKHYYDALKTLSQSQKSYTDAERSKIIYDAWEQDFRNKYLYLFGTYPENRYISTAYGVVAKDWMTSSKERDKVNDFTIKY